MAQERSASRLGRALGMSRRKARLTQGALALLVGCNERSVRQADGGMGRTDRYLEMAAALGQTVAGRSLPPGELLGERLLALRRRTGQSHRGLAAASGVSAATIRAIEHGGLGHLAVLEHVADAFRAGFVIGPSAISLSPPAPRGRPRGTPGRQPRPCWVPVGDGLPGLFATRPTGPMADRVAEDRSRLVDTIRDWVKPS